MNIRLVRCFVLSVTMFLSLCICPFHALAQESGEAVSIGQVTASVENNNQAGLSRISVDGVVVADIQFTKSNGQGTIRFVPMNGITGVSFTGVVRTTDYSGLSWGQETWYSGLSKTMYMPDHGHFIIHGTYTYLWGQADVFTVYAY